MVRLLLGVWLLVAPAVVPAQPMALQDIVLTDTAGQPLGASLRGRPVLMHFVYTGCSSTCPTQVRELAQVHDALPPQVREQVRFVSVSLDPRQDTPAALRDFARRMDAVRPGWHFAAGTLAATDRLVRRLNLLGARNPRLEDHATGLYLHDATGRLVQRYAGVPVDRARLVAEITTLSRAR
jgi:protein SCO1